MCLYNFIKIYLFEFVWDDNSIFVFKYEEVTLLS